MGILIVDDSPLARMVLRDCLLEAGYEVYEAGDFSEARDKFIRFHPEIVFKDLYMPGWDAIDSIQFLKKLDTKVKIIICSTGTSKEVILEGLKAGACDFLIKPINRLQVLTLMKQLA